jgi:hypothetical protein
MPGILKARLLRVHRILGFAKPRDQRGRDLTKLPSPSQWTGLRMIGRKGAFFETIKHEAILEAKV